MTVKEFITAIGGNLAAATAFGVTKNAVCNWKSSNTLPARLHLRALKMASARGIAFDPERPSKSRKAA